MAQIFDSIPSRAVFLNDVLVNNPGYVVIKYGASWCGPCKKIHNYIQEKKSGLQGNIAFYDLDVDDNMDLYAFLKQKKMVAGIPVILAYKKTNITYVSDFSVIGTNTTELDLFFDKISEQSS